MTGGVNGARALRSVLRGGSAMMVLGLAAIATPAAAVVFMPAPITYTRSGTYQDATYSYSITTDGNIGQLTGSDITAFSFQSSRPTYADVSFNSSNGNVFYPSSGLSATASDLNFDFDSGHGAVFYSNTTPVSVCFDGGEGLCGGSSGHGLTNIYVGSQNFTDISPMSGVQSVASAGGGPGAPAPLLGVGLIPALGSFGGLIATRLRRRKAALA